MIPFDTLAAAWRQERARRLARQSLRPRLGPEGLSLGPMVVVAKGTTDRWGSPALAVDGNKARILALLSVAYWRPVEAGVIDALRRASKALAGRNPALAPILIAQIGLGPLHADERVAFRLFAAERLLDAGLAPHALMKGLGLDPRPLDALAKYSPDQPRDDRGRWTSAGGPSGAADAHVADPEAGQRMKPVQLAESGQSLSDAPLVLVSDEAANDNSAIQELCLRAYNDCVAISRSRSLAPQDYLQFRQSCIEHLDDCTLLAEQSHPYSRFGDFVEFPGGGVMIFRNGQAPKYVPPKARTSP